jgi:hypothetical protein
VSDLVWGALIAGGVSIITTVINRWGDTKRLTGAINRIAEGLNIGLDNDRVIFRAFRENKINGESEAQERKMDDYFQRCAISGYKVKENK